MWRWLVLVAFWYPFLPRYCSLVGLTPPRPLFTVLPDNFLSQTRHVESTAKTKDQSRNDNKIINALPSTGLVANVLKIYLPAGWFRTANPYRPPECFVDKPYTSTTGKKSVLFRAPLRPKIILSPFCTPRVFDAPATSFTNKMHFDLIGKIQNFNIPPKISQP